MNFSDSQLMFFFIISITINLIIFVFISKNLFIKVSRKFNRVQQKKEIDFESFENFVIESGIKMIQSNNSKMVWGQNSGFLKEILSRIYKSSYYDYKIYNYPRAFLFFGITEYLKTSEVELSDEKWNIIKKNFDKLFFKPSSHRKIKRIDEVPFGIVSINLFEKYKENKYKDFVDSIFIFIKKLIKNDLIFYRENSNVVMNDSLGMTIPFLISYYQAFKSNEAKSITLNQIEYYIKYGVDHGTRLPSHGINFQNKVKVGSTNWGRGIGWYFLALSKACTFSSSFQSEFDQLKETIVKLKRQDGSWDQFLGQKSKFDASSTVLFLYGLILNNHKEFNKSELYETLKDKISNKGEIEHTSGDTYSLNNYSNLFGVSELSQGVLILILSELNRKNEKKDRDSYPTTS